MHVYGGTQKSFLFSLAQGYVSVFTCEWSDIGCCENLQLLLPTRKHHCTGDLENSLSSANADGASRCRGHSDAFIHPTTV